MSDIPFQMIATGMVPKEFPFDISALQPWAPKLLAAAAVLLMLLMVSRRVRRAMRRRRPARLHPNLQVYGQDGAASVAEMSARRRAEADHIVATSSTQHIAGYDITEQVEAVYVDGFRRPEEAMEGLKAAAAMKGANAVTNVNHNRGTAEKCSASGDAVIVRKIASTPDSPTIDITLSDESRP